MASVRVVMYDPGYTSIERAVEDRVTRPVTTAVAEDMTRMVPVLSGALRATIAEEIMSWNVGHVNFGDVGAGVDYHLYQEFGTSQMAAQPYARPALYRARSL
jgi:hypothetical protein